MRLGLALAIALAVTGCKALPPPPVLAPHAATAPEREGATTAMIVIGFAGELLGGGGVGVALRIEHQTSERTALGIELTGGEGGEDEYEDRARFRHWLAGVRGYGRFAPARDHSVALTYGAGASLMATGLVTGTLNAGGEASDGSDVVPLGALGVALAVPLRHGKAFYEAPLPEIVLGEPVMPRPAGAWLRPTRTPLVPHTELFIALDLGLLVPLGDTGNRLSLDVGGAYALRADNAIFSASFADAQRF